MQSQSQNLSLRVWHGVHARNYHTATLRMYQCLDMSGHCVPTSYIWAHADFWLGLAESSLVQVLEADTTAFKSSLCLCHEFIAAVSLPPTILSHITGFYGATYMLG
jgi:hypothetical protein